MDHEQQLSTVAMNSGFGRIEQYVFFSCFIYYVFIFGICNRLYSVVRTIVLRTGKTG